MGTHMLYYTCPQGRGQYTSREVERMDELMGKCELLYEGKVREVYDCDDKLVMVATDRISAFDHILKNLAVL